VYPFAAHAADSCTGQSVALKRHMADSEVYACLNQTRIIRFAVVSGPGLMRALSQVSGPVRILDSDITDGLDFSLLRKSAFRPDPMPEAAPKRRSPSKRKSNATAPHPIDRGLMMQELGALYPLNQVVAVDSGISIKDTRIQPMQRFDVENHQLALDATGVIFARPVDFTGDTFQGGVRFSRTAFLDDANFTGSAFVNRANFDAVWFGQRGVFTRARFGGTLLLTFARFAQEALFQRAEFAASAAFDDSRFCGPVDFSETRFTENAQFPLIRAAGDAVFSGATFARGATFLNAEFAADLNLTNIQSDGVLTFASASAGSLHMGLGLKGGTTVIGATLDFNGAGIHRTSIENVVFARALTFTTTQFGKPAVAADVFRNADVRGDRRMGDAAARFGCEYRETAQFQQDETLLRDVTFRDDVSFRGAIFRGRTSLLDVSFGKTADMTGVAFKAGVGTSSPALRLSRMHAENVNLEWKNMPELSAFIRQPGDPPVSSLLDELATGFKARDRQVDALQIKQATGWMKWREARACLNPGSRTLAAISDEECSYIASGLRFIAWPLWGLSSGFGTSLARLAVLVFLVDVGFALIYWRFGRIVRSDSGKKESDASLRLRFLDLPEAFCRQGRSHSAAAGLVTDLSTALHLSSVILLRFGAKNLRVYGNIGPIRMGTVVTAEWLLGIPLLLDLVYTLQSQPFVQTALHGVIG
jgi:hypothetical protein